MKKSLQIMKDQNYCKCCLSKECCKDISSEHSFGDVIEVYSDMLRTTFNVQIVEESGAKSLICNSCVDRLRDAAAFKKQVLDSQEYIIKLSTIKDVIVDDDCELKVEYEDHDDFDDTISDGWSDSDCNWLKNDDDKGEIFVIKLEDKVKTTRRTITPKLKTKSSRKNATSVDKASLKSVTAKPNKQHPLKGKKLPKLSLSHKNQCENTLKLIENSNMCPFKSFRTKFGCFACKAMFLDPIELRRHTATHMDSKYLATRVKQMRGLTYRNVEISDLKCAVCSESVADLSDLRQHLETHNITFQGIDHFLIPYRLKEGFRCALCDLSFNTFTRLSIHMNGHYTNNVCEICGRSFINRVSLRTHLSGMHKEKKCTLCSALFYKQNALVRHMRKTHNLSKEKRYCTLCERSFPYSYLLEEHKIKEHGAKRPISNCSECGKTFNTPQNLRIHVRCVHMKERNYPCCVCGMRFFTKCDQRRHERTHEDVRAFSCSYCDAKFKSKDSCRRHLRRQHGHVFGQESSSNSVG